MKNSSPGIKSSNYNALFIWLQNCWDSLIISKPGQLEFKIFDLQKSSSSITGGMLHVPREGPDVFPPTRSQLESDGPIVKRNPCQKNANNERQSLTNLYGKKWNKSYLLQWLLHIFSDNLRKGWDPELLINDHTSLQHH